MANWRAHGPAKEGNLNKLWAGPELPKFTTSKIHWESRCSCEQEKRLEKVSTMASDPTSATPHCVTLNDSLDFLICRLGVVTALIS